MNSQGKKRKWVKKLERSFTDRPKQADLKSPKAQR